MTAKINRYPDLNRTYIKALTPYGFAMLDELGGAWQDKLGMSPWTAEEDIVLVGVEINCEMCAWNTAEGTAMYYAEVSQTAGLNTDGCLIREQCASGYEEIVVACVQRWYHKGFRSIMFPARGGIPVSEGASLYINVHHQVSPIGSGYECTAGIQGRVFYLRK